MFRRFLPRSRCLGPLLRWLALHSVVLVASAPARAQEVAPSPPGATDTGLEAPRLLELASAALPPKLEHREGKVLLRLLIDATGRVVEADVISGMGPDHDAVARAAMLASRFAPARRAGSEIPARVLFAYEFPPPPARRTQPSGPWPGPVRPVRPARAGATRAPALTAPPAASAAPPVAPATPVLSAEPGEIVVHGLRVADRIRRSAHAVRVLSTEKAKQRTADMGEVLARTEGVGVRRSGGLGSWTRFSLNGLSDDQIRFFVDGVPLTLLGFPFGISNVPVNLVERIEIYRGVVPVRYGSDALGGAVDLVTDRGVRGTRGALSYEIGSFDSHRLTLAGRHLDEPSGFFVGANGFADYSRNDYPVDVEIANETTGRVEQARAHRFHDGYRAAGVSVEAGFVNRPWARRLLLRTFATDYEKEHQHKFGVMSVPYGEVVNGETSSGASLRFEHEPSEGLVLDALFGYTNAKAHFRDASTCIYDWFGRCIGQRTEPGEDQSPPRDQRFSQHDVFGRMSLRYRLSEQQAIQIAMSPTFYVRSAEERRADNPQARARLAAEQGSFSWVHGVEHQLDSFDHRLQNVVFVKQYAQALRAEELVPGNMTKYRSKDRNTLRFGLGDGLRYGFSELLYAKASYEWATRLPRPNEVFGDGALIVANLDLAPETSHNGNLGFTIDVRDSAFGAWRLGAEAFVRAIQRMIVLNNRLQTAMHVNVSGARSAGVEANAEWTSPGNFLAIGGNVTYQDFRKTSNEGNFARSKGERMPNRPWLFANGSVRLELGDLARTGDTAALTWDTRYVHEFFLGWANWGARDEKGLVPSQLLHSLALTYVTRDAPRSVSFTMEAQNVTDEKAFDFYGVERPGRALYSKVALEL